MRLTVDYQPSTHPPGRFGSLAACLTSTFVGTDIVGGIAATIRRANDIYKFNVHFGWKNLELQTGNRVCGVVIGSGSIIYRITACEIWV